MDLGEVCTYKVWLGVGLGLVEWAICNLEGDVR